MPLNDKLLYLLGTKEAIAEALKNKGASVDGIPFREYARAIDELSTSGNAGMEEQLNFYESIYYGTLSGDVVIPNFITRLTKVGFSENQNVTSVYIPDSVTTLAERTFYYCRGLKTATLPTTITNIPTYCFYYCTSLASINLDNVKTIGRSSFYSNKIATISTPNLESVGETAFYDCKLVTLDLPKIKTIGNASFSYNASLETVSIGNQIESIHNTATASQRPFRECNNLTTINIDKPFGSLEVPDHHWGAVNSTIYWNDGVQTPPNETVSVIN